MVKKRWNPDADDSPDAAKDTPMSAEDKQVVKQNILNLMCSVPHDVQRQLSEALAIISSHDFPGMYVCLYMLGLLFQSDA